MPKGVKGGKEDLPDPFKPSPKVKRSPELRRIKAHSDWVDLRDKYARWLEELREIRSRGVCRDDIKSFESDLIKKFGKVPSDLGVIEGFLVTLIDMHEKRFNAICADRPIDRPLEYYMDDEEKSAASSVGTEGAIGGAVLGDNVLAGSSSVASVPSVSSKVVSGKDEGALYEPQNVVASDTFCPIRAFNNLCGLLDSSKLSNAKVGAIRLAFEEILREYNGVLDELQFYKGRYGDGHSVLETLKAVEKRMEAVEVAIRGDGQNVVESLSVIEKRLGAVELACKGREGDSGVKSFSDVVVGGRVASSGGVPLPLKIPSQVVPTIFVKPVEGSRDNKKIKEDFMASFDPVKEHIHVRNVRSAGNSRICLEMEDADSVKKIKSRGKVLAEKGLAVVDEVKVRPKVIVYDVESSLSDGEFVKLVWEQNFSHIGTAEEFATVFKVAFRKGMRNKPKVNLVCEASPVCRETIMEKGRLFVSWYSCKVEDFVGLSRCFKCQEFGHVAKYCRGSEVCRTCAKTGHKSNDCPTPDVVVCPPCKGRGLEHNHVVGCKACHSYNRGLEAMLKRVDFDV